MVNGPGSRLMAKGSQPGANLAALGHDPCCMNLEWDPLGHEP